MLRNDDDKADDSDGDGGNDAYTRWADSQSQEQEEVQRQLTFPPFEMRF